MPPRELWWWLQIKVPELFKGKVDEAKAAHLMKLMDDWNSENGNEA